MTNTGVSTEPILLTEQRGTVWLPSVPPRVADRRAAVIDRRRDRGRGTRRGMADSREDLGSAGYFRSRSRPSCMVLATRTPSRL